MCDNTVHDILEETERKKYRLSDFFNMHWDNYVKNPKQYIYPRQFKAVNAMRTCRTAFLGVDLFSCPECGLIQEHYYSCKHRFCPSCSWRDTVKWAEHVKHRMLKTDHRHVVCTLPHSLKRLIKYNEYALLSLLMRSSAHTFQDWMHHKYQISIGIISVLHTFGETKGYHPHVHMIVSWGGIRKKYNNLKRIDNSYVDYTFLQKKFRNRFEEGLISMYDNKELYHEFSSRQDFMNYIRSVNKTDWVLHLESPMETPEKVIRYIGRYSKRACLSEYKITEIEGEYISFKYKDYSDRDVTGKAIEKVKRMHYRDFFPRLLQHVPLTNFKIVRYYGVYSNKGSAPEEFFSKPELKEQEQEVNIRICKECNEELVYIHTEYDIRRKSERTEPYISGKHNALIVDRSSRIYRYRRKLTEQLV
jgi:hypothetical protein